MADGFQKPGGDRKPSNAGKTSSAKGGSSSRAGPGFVARQASGSGASHSSSTSSSKEARKRSSASGKRSSREKELLRRGGPFGIEDVLALDRATSCYLVPMNKEPDVEFLRLKVTIGESDGEVLFDKDLVPPAEEGEPSSVGDADRGSSEPDVSVAAQPGDGDVDVLGMPYMLPAACLGTMCTAYTEFRAKKEVHKFYMVERFFFGKTLLKDLRFEFGYCIPGSVNTASITYDTPEVSDELKKEIMSKPGQVRADSFYFNDGELVMHYKSNYTYF